VKRYSVERWSQKPLQAAAISVGVCPEGDLVGIDLHAQDGSVFAHAHFGPDQADEFWRDLAEAITAARKTS
jgi:hypothetical protein